MTFDSTMCEAIYVYLVKLAKQIVWIFSSVITKEAPEKMMVWKSLGSEREWTANPLMIYACR